MSLTIDLQPEVERGLLAQAQAKGVSLVDYAEEILSREAMPPNTPSHRTGQELIDACTRVRGLLTDEEVDSLFSRTQSSGRTIDFA